MNQRFYDWVVLTATILVVSILIVSKVIAGDSSDWISASLEIQKQADTTSLPSSLSGNIDCSFEAVSNCTIPTSYGSAGQNSTIRFNGSSGFMPIYSYLENRQRFLPIPNSSTAITYSTEPAYGLYLYFNYNLSSSITKAGTEYHINRPPDGKLADKSNNRLAADYGSMSFSQNGQWMVVSVPNVAMLRVNLQTFEVLPFAPKFDYTIGIDPAIKTAITNDGRYAIVSSKDFNRFSIYDLSTCGLVPDNIISSVECQSRDLEGYMKQQFPAFSFVNQARFIDDQTLSIYANYLVGDLSKTARFLISTAQINNQLEYLALGDSFISGEGAFDYQGGTDTPANKCHLSLLAYPNLIGHDLNYNSYHSVACSGALTQDIIDTTPSYTGQADNRKVQRSERSTDFINSVYSSFEPGYIDQLDFVSRNQPKTIAVSVGGNDTGFSKIVQNCSMYPDTCYSAYEDRLELVNQINSEVFPRLVQTYDALRAAGPPDMRVYVIGYPQIAKPGGDCALNVHLNSDEIEFSKQLIDYLDNVIKTAAANAGVYYVDTQDALNGHRLCEAGPGSVAMNGLSAGNDAPNTSFGPIGNESYHPNPTGYQLLENSILNSTNNLTAGMPPPNLNATLPSLNGLDLLNVPHSGRDINTIEFDQNLSADLAYLNVPFDVSIGANEHSLAPGTALRAEIHSNPIALGSYTTNPDGNLVAQISIPSEVPAGYHSLHFYGTDISGQKIDIYKFIYVASTADDLDGNGLLDSTQFCIGIAGSGEDFDKDGVDDACDGNITQPVASLTEAGQLAGTISAQGGLSVMSTALTNFGSDQTDKGTEVYFTPSPQSQNTKVLGASTIKTARVPHSENQSLRLSKSYITAGSLAIFSISSLAYFAKRSLL